MTKDLIAKLKALDGPSKELDWEIGAWLCETVLGWVERRVPPDYHGENESIVLVPPHGAYGYPLQGMIHRWFNVPRPQITESLDYAIAFAKKVAPVNLHGYLQDHQKVTARLGYVDKHGKLLLHVEGVHKSSPAIAVVIGALKYYEVHREAMEKQRQSDPIQ